MVCTGVNLRVRGAHAGACSQAPNAAAVYLTDGREVLYTRIDSLEKSTAAVSAALGSTPNVQDAALSKRLSAARHNPDADDPGWRGPRT